MSLSEAPSRWIDSLAPTSEDFEQLAAEAYARLPRSFRSLCGDIVIQIADFPEEEVLTDMGLSSPYDLLGLFQGVGLAHQSASSADMPNRIWLYRRPIIDYWAEYEETLGDLVAHVLVHEIGHHFGLSDEDMETIEANAGD